MITLIYQMCVNMYHFYQIRMYCHDSIAISGKEELYRIAGNIRTKKFCTSASTSNSAV